MSIEFLVEDCVDADFNSTLPAQRRNDILTTLKEKQEPLIQYTISFITQGINEIANSSSSSSSISVLNSVLRMLGPIATLATPEDLCTENSDVSALIPVMLSIVDLQEQTAQLLCILISQRKLSVDLFYKFLVVLPGPLVQTCGTFSVFCFLFSQHSLATAQMIYLLRFLIIFSCVCFIDYE